MNSLPNNILAVDPDYYARWAQLYGAAKGGLRVMNSGVSPGKRADIVITGLLMSTVTPDIEYWGIDATGYDEIAQRARALAASDVEEVRVYVDSGGGYTWGIDQAIVALQELRGTKKITVEVGSIAASAAYWLASIGHEIRVNRFSFIGGIGSFMALVDSSKFYQDMGFDVKLIASGKHKGVGMPGVPIADDQLDPEREAVAQITEAFIGDVQGYRPAFDRAYATGRTWLGMAAIEIGLADVAINERTDHMSVKMQAAHAEDVAPDKEEEKPVEVAEEEAPPEETPVEDPEKESADEEETPDDASEDPVALERERCATMVNTFAADPDFAAEMISANKTLVEAKAAYFDKYKGKASKPAAKDKTIAANEPTSHAGADWNASVKAYAAKHNTSLIEAAKRMERDNPDLYKANFNR